MSLTSITNKWASRVVIVLQLITWSAVSIVLLQKGVSSLQRRMLETTSHVIESIQSGDHFTEIDQRIDNHGGRDTYSSRVSRITRDKEEHNLSNNNDDDNDSNDNSTGSGIIHEEQATTKLLPKSVTTPPKESGNATTKETDLVDRDGSTKQKSSVRGRSGEQAASTLGKSRSRMSFYRMSDGGTTTAIAMVVIGAVMLMLAPLVIILRILDERRQARKLVALSPDAREDLPPAYEQVVLMSEAPRYSTLSLIDDYPSPASSAAASLIKSDST